MLSYKKQFLRYIAVVLFVQPAVVAHISYEQHKQWHVDSLLPLAQSGKTGKKHIDQLQRLYSILGVHEAAQLKAVNKQEVQRAIDLHKELELFVGRGLQADKSIVMNIDKTISAAGSIMLRRLTSESTATIDPARFANRQQFIKKLVEDQQLFKRVDAVCQSWAANEDHTLKNWDHSGVSEREIDKYLWMWSKLNKSSSAIAAGIYASLFTSLAGPLYFAIQDITMQAHFCYRHHGTQNFIIGDWRSPNYGQRELRAIGFVDSVVYAFRGAGDIRHAINIVKETGRYIADKAQGKNVSFNASPDLAFGFYQWVGLAVMSYYLYRNIKALQNSKNELTLLQDRLIGMNHLVQSITAFKALAKEHPELTKALSTIEAADKLLSNSSDKEFSELVEMLASKTFQGQVSFFSNGGKIILAQKSFQEHQNKFVGAIELMGELDACLSLAKLIKESKDKPVGYCLAQLTDEQKPHIKLQQFWHPMLDPYKAVPNDIELGGGKPQHVILTGSNTGGKSTVGLKSTLTALYLAHSLGVAPAQVCQAAKCDFASYIHVNDDTGSGKSAFKAEVDRVAEIIDRIKKHKDKNIVVVIDELFRGAGAGPAEFGSYKVADYICQQDNVISVIATHVPKLTELEHQTNGRCINMKIDVLKDAQGNLIKPHKLEPGVSDSNIAVDLMKRDLSCINFDNQ